MRYRLRTTHNLGKAIIPVEIDQQFGRVDRRRPMCTIPLTGECNVG